MTVPVLDLSSYAIDDTGYFTPAWVNFFQDLANQVNQTAQADVAKLWKARGATLGANLANIEAPIPWATPVIDPSADVSLSGSVLTINTAGVYEFTVTLRVDANNQTELFLGTYINGVQDMNEIVSDYVAHDTNQRTGAVTLSTAGDLAAGTTVEFRGFADCLGTCVMLDPGTILLVKRWA